MTIVPFLQKFSFYILNPLIYLIFAVAFLYFFWGIAEFINSQTSDSKRGDGKKKIVYGLLGMFIMFSAYGIIRLLLDTFGLAGPRYPGF